MTHRITDSCIGCTACILACPVDCIDGAWQDVHVIDPGRCIDCSACAAICPVDAIVGWWVTETVPKRDHWWEPVIDPDHCSGCDFCVEICPQQCLELEGGGQFGGLAQLVRAHDCIGCRQCEEVCAKGAITMQIPSTGLVVSVRPGEDVHSIKLVGGGRL